MSMAAAIRTKAWMELEEEAERFSLWKIKAEFFFMENQLCSSIKVEKRGGFVRRKKNRERVLQNNPFEGQKAARIQKRKKVLWISVPPRRGVMR